jgi:hypothetical protein
MIRVRVPLDIHAVACNGSGAFALATPLRVRDLLTAAVIEALGPRAPQDKRQRVVGYALAGLADRTYVVEIDGRLYDDHDEVVVCAGIASLRFFLRRALRAA